MSTLNKIVQLASEIELGQRDSWDQYFMAVAYIASLRSTCGSRRCGAVIVKDKRVVASGYNGYPPGAPHCVDGGCPRFEAKKQGLIESGAYSNSHPCDAAHAEHSALNQCLEQGISTKDTIMYCTTFPCIECAKKILGAGIRKVYFLEGYPDDYSREYFMRYGVELIKVEI